MQAYKILPFRLASNRFPNKPLCDFFGKTLIETALLNASQINEGEIILTSPQADYDEILKKTDILQKYQYTFIPTSESCACATERVLELMEHLNGELFVSIPVDEAALIPAEIEQALKAFSMGEEKEAQALTLYCDFFSLDDACSPLSAKLVLNRKNEVLYMSRALIPLKKSGETEATALKKHVGVYFFRRPFLEKLKALSGVATTLDRLEGLEQLRWLELGLMLRARKITHYGFGIDVPENISLLEARIACLQQQKK